jgi:hypothetical protein
MALDTRLYGLDPTSVSPAAIRAEKKSCYRRSGKSSSVVDQKTPTLTLTQIYKPRLGGATVNAWCTGRIRLLAAGWVLKPPVAPRW